MRSAGCIINDIADRKIDAQVERTKNRPLASGEVTLTEASMLLVVLGLIGLAVSVILGHNIIFLSLLWLPLIVAYPLMKRITWWPQIFLGITFNAGAIFGWIAFTGGIALAPILLYLGAIGWTLGYDTIYAMQDRHDDMQIGVKSSALRVGHRLIPFVVGCYSLFSISLFACGILLDLPWIYYAFITLVTLHLSWQVMQLRSNSCPDYGAIFSSNVITGILILVGCLCILF